MRLRYIAELETFSKFSKSHFPNFSVMHTVLLCHLKSPQIYLVSNNVLYRAFNYARLQLDMIIYFVIECL